MGYSQQLFKILSDGQFHSGEDLSRRLGVSRTSVWNHIRSLRQLGLEVFAVHGQGYRLDHRVEPIDQKLIVSQLDAGVVIPAWEIHWSIDSSNTLLLNRAREGAVSGTVCLTELQTQGRGRRGRQWSSPLGANIYLSILWRFQQGAAALSGLNIATAVALSAALQRLAAAQQKTLPGLNLKWPNDVLYDGKKLAGILMEVTGEAAGPCAVVLGVGMNVSMSAAGSESIDQPWTDLRSAMGDTPSRNELIALVLSEFMAMFQQFEQHDLAAFLPRWQPLDGFAGQAVRLHTAQGDIEGIAQGVAGDGTLLVEIQGQIQRFHSGEISLRKIHSDADKSESDEVSP
ncbi:MAG: bifunctional biotin--[acetyl-CoA-carboxylase] ligase/biotin operon repressor BirA [Gammaproteobacteria bacterium]|nr:bifunctional biotin--[acetyl-CoA-carboxylase] ligase/biotin operon repressor BirA [Gammaproteobacteria bacterium]MDH5803392.1 bifunctional biotin--[acetyl-CoA-carboxylase] ligase/biotin operon repressor BirA [Gammaproteobacteria bacterium]